MKPETPYKKYFYWLTQDEDEALVAMMLQEGQTLKTARGVVCSPLDPIARVARVPPGVWSETCIRQGSWYRTSPRNGQTLVIAPAPLKPWEHRRGGVLSASAFVPPRLASPEDKRRLIAKAALRQRMPPEWETAGRLERQTYLRWAGRLGSDVKDYGFLYLSHTANHANFIAPDFFIEDQEGLLPFSLDHTAHLCSCCVELFGILGDAFPRKLVAPCPGASLFARLPPDRYLLVTREDTSTGEIALGGP